MIDSRHLKAECPVVAIAPDYVVPTIKAAPEDLPQSAAPSSVWDRAVAAYEVALEAEKEYGREVWEPAYLASNEAGTEFPDEVDRRMTRLFEVRMAAEDVFMPIPAETAEQALLKVIVAFNEGRDCTPPDFLTVILADAKRLTGRTGQ